MGQALKRLKLFCVTSNNLNDFYLPITGKTGYFTRMNANELTSIQEQVTEQLSVKGFRVDSVSDCGDDEATVFMSKRIKSYSTLYAEVDARGLVNGVSISEFLGSLTSTQP